VKRGAQPNSLDQGLKQQALEAGVQIHFEQTIPLEEADIVATGPISREIFAVDKGIVFETDLEETNIFLVNDTAAHKGYSYLLVAEGYGCMCTVLFDNFTELDDCFEVTQRMFDDMIDFDIRSPRPVAGIGSFSTQNVFQQGKSFYVGEAAGIQDLMWGFGIKTAVESGALAARCILEGSDYPEAARARFNNKQKATLAGRFFWEMARFGNYALVVNQKINNARRGKAFDLSFFYNFSLLHKMIYPLARARMRSRYPNLRL
jgi:flavin-dependent dehydrogenase